MGLALLSTTITTAQTIFSEDFQGLVQDDPLPAGWAIFDVDGQTPNTDVAAFTDAWRVNENPNDATDIVITSNSWYTPAGTANDWVFTPAITLTTGNELVWNARAQDSFFPDGYEVYISTEQTVASAQGTGAVFAIASESATEIERTVDLSAFDGQTVFISWRNNSTDNFLLDIDDIIVRVIPSFNVNLSDVVAPEYTQIPLDQISTYGLAATINNDGPTEVTGANITLDVVNTAGTSVYSETTADVTIAAGANNTFTLAGYSPTEEGTFTYNFTLSINETEPDLSDNSLDFTFQVTDDIYSRDTGNGTGTLGIGNATAGQLGQQFEILTLTNLTSITAAIANTSTTVNIDGTTTTFEVFDMAGGVPNASIAVTDEFTVMGQNQFYTAAVTGGGVMLAPGTYTLVINEPEAVNISIITDTNNFVLGTTWVIFGANPWLNNEAYGFNTSYILRANFNNVVLSTNDAGELTNFRFALYPNPTNGVLNIDNPDGLQVDKLTLFDMLGKEVLTKNSSTLQGNSTIDVSSLAPAIYTVRIEGSFGVYSQKIIVE